MAKRTSSVPAGGGVAFDLNTGNAALPASIGLDDGSMLAGLYSLKQPGRYQLQLTYAMPPSAFATNTSPAVGDAACAGTGDPVTVVFSVGAAGSKGSGVPWLLVAVVAGVVVLLVVIVLVFWIRAHKRRGGGGTTTTVATAIALVLLASVGGVALEVIIPAPAYAGVIYGPDPSAAPGIYQTYTDCLGRIAAFDPGLMQALNPAKVLVLPIPGGAPQTMPSKTGGPYDSTISWDPEKGTGFTGETSGAAYDPCMGLYHELNHARDRATDSDTSQECDDTGVLVDEVRATVAENSFRAAQKPPLAPRTTYDGKRIPPTLDGCTPPKKKKDERVASNDPGTCRGIDGPCGSHNGDPHIGTFDGYRFDLQAVGEFVAVHSTAGDMDIQVRQSPFTGSRTVSVNHAVAMRAAGVRLGFYLDHNNVVVRRDGAVVDIPIGTSGLGPNGAKINHIVDPRQGHSFAVVWPDGSAAWVAQAGLWGLSLNVQPRLTRDGTLTGLFGPFNGDRTDDVSTADGRKLAEPPPFDDVYHTFATGWRVTDTGSLFDYATDASTKDFNDFTFPDEPSSVGTLPAPQRDSASVACTLLGVIDPISLADCILDVASTGQAIFAVSAERAQTAAGLGDVGGIGVETSGGGSTGPTQTLSVTAPGGEASMAFDGTAGQRAYIQVTATTLPNSCGVPELVAPQSTTISFGCVSGGKGFLDGTLLPTTGKYQVLVRPSGGATGTITMRVILSTDVTAPIDRTGQAATETVTAAGQQAKLTFTATAGEKVFVDVLSTTSLPPSCGIIYIATVSGSTESLGCTSGNGTGFVDTTTFKNSGAYAIVLDPSAGGVGSATVKLTVVQDQQQPIVLNGAPVKATVSQAGATSFLTFNGTAGQKVTIDGTGATGKLEGCGSIRTPTSSLTTTTKRAGYGRR